MPAFIHHLATQTPACAYATTEARERMEGRAPDQWTRRQIHPVYDRDSNSCAMEFSPGLTIETALLDLVR